MKQEFRHYLSELGLTKIHITRAEEIYKFYSEICSEKLNDIFVSDYISDDGRREFGNLLFFSENFTMEAHEFLSTDNFDYAPLSPIYYLRIYRENYFPGQVDEKSRLRIEVFLQSKINFDLRATGANCEQLWNLFTSRLCP